MRNSAGVARGNEHATQVFCHDHRRAQCNAFAAIANGAGPRGGAGRKYGRSVGRIRSRACRDIGYRAGAAIELHLYQDRSEHGRRVLALAHAAVRPTRRTRACSRCWPARRRQGLRHVYAAPSRLLQADFRTDALPIAASSSVVDYRQKPAPTFVYRAL